MPDLDDAVDRWKRIPADVGLKFDKDRGIAECDVPHPTEPGWRVWGRYVLSQSRLILIEVRVLSPAIAGNPMGWPQVPAEQEAGITMRMLRDVRLGDLLEPVQSLAALRSAGRLGEKSFAAMAAAPNRGRDDAYYAEWARRIHEATTSNTRSPIADVADAGGVKHDQVRDLATEARIRGLYVSRGRGRAGGYLTDKGREALNGAKRQRSVGR